jgi:asparagine synthase (glutamine-hydrolysing)
VFWGGVHAFSERAKLDLLSPRLRRRFEKESSWGAIRPIHERFLQNAWEKTPVKWMSYLDLNLRLPELLLMRLDKMGMGASLETRVPFLDHKFVELAMSVPEQVITRGNESKHIMKKAVRGLIPDDIIDRRNQFGEFARRELSQFCEQTDFLNPVAVGRLVRSGRGRDAWFLLNFTLWWKQFIQGDNGMSANPMESLVASL